MIKLNNVQNWAKCAMAKGLGTLLLHSLPLPYLHDFVSIKVSRHDAILGKSTVLKMADTDYFFYTKTHD
jgi:hypothetical protein